MERVRVGILGATGEVGREMMKILEERAFPLSSLRLFASEKSAGKELPFKGEKLRVEAAGADSFGGLDLVLGAVSGTLSRQFAPLIREAEACYIDNSSAFRLCADVPLVIPEINPEDAKIHRGIIANPNCSTIITLMAVSAAHRLSPIRSMTVATYQAASGAGARGQEELTAQMKALSEGREADFSVFPCRLAENVIPFIGKETQDGYTDEEMKMETEGRKILHQPALSVTCTCVRVPVLRSHSMAITVKTEKPLSPEEVMAQVQSTPGCILTDESFDLPFPTPLLSNNRDEVFVGRIRRDRTCENGLSLFCSADQVRRGAALNAVRIAELLFRGE